MIYNVSDVTLYILEKEHSLGWYISNLKLQKILYFVQANFMVEKGEKCFYEPILAWSFGPVVPSVYRKYDVYGSSAIPYSKKYKRGDFLILDRDKPLIDEMVEACLEYSATDLVNITKNQTPWKNGYQEKGNREISPEGLKEYFEKKEIDRKKY